VVAEKAALMVTYGPDHSREKDILDLWLISRRFAFNGAAVLRAVQQVFSERDAARMIQRDDGYWEAAFSEARFHGDFARRWADLVEVVRPELRPGSGPATLAGVAHFLRPILDAARQETDLVLSWHPSNGWEIRP